MSEEDLEKALDEIFEEDTQTIRESMKSLIRSYDNALGELVESDKRINELQKENEELEKTIDQSLAEQKERDKYTHELEQRLEKLQKENEQLKDDQLWSEATIEWLKERFIPKEKVDAKIKELEENEDFYREQGRMYEYEGKINLLKRLLAKE